MQRTPKDEQLEDAAHHEAMSSQLAREISRMTWAETKQGDELFEIFSKGGEPVYYDEKYLFKSFRIKNTIFKKYIKYCIDNNQNIYRLINTMIEEWLETKRIEDQDRIEREAHI